MNFEIITGTIPKPLKAVVYGMEGIGKSSFAAQAPNPLFIDTEGSTNRMDVRRLPAPSSFAMLLDEIRWVKQNPGVCQTLVLDTIDWAEKLAYSHVCSLKNCDSIESPGYGAGYRYAFEEMGKLLNLLDEVSGQNIHIIITAHAALRKFDQPDGQGSYDRYEMKLQNSPKCNTAAMVKEWCDMLLFANYETFVVQNSEKKNKAQGGKRVMYTSHMPAFDAKNRFQLPDKLPFAFQSVAHCFGVSPILPVQQTVTAAPVPESSTTPAGAMHDLFTTKPETAQVKPEAVQRPNGIPDALWDRMRRENVTEEQIRQVVSQRGYYPEQTPIANYDPTFIEGVLISAWDQVYKMIKEL